MKTSLLFLSFAVFLSCCAPSFYSPNQQNVPGFQKKKEVRLNAARGFDGFDVQATYAVTNHLGVQLNSLFYSFDWNEFRKYSEGNGIELGLGYYKPFSNFVFETYGLIGKGKFTNRDLNDDPYQPENDGYLKSDILRFALQPALTYKRKYYSISLSSRLSSINYYKVEGHYYDYFTDLGNELRHNSSYFLFEPALTFRAGLEKLKFQIQFVTANNLTKKPFL